MTTTTPPALPRIDAYVDHWASQTPNALAFVDEGTDRRTYQTAKQHRDAVAAGLLAAGVKPGDRVGTYGRSSADCFTAFLATAGIGATWMGMNPKYTVEELAYIVSDADPVVVLAMDGSDDEMAKLTDAGARRILRSADLHAMDPGHAPVLTTHPDAPAAVVYTSGTTGSPKGALVPHHGLVTCCRIQFEHWVTDGEVSAVIDLPINHIGWLGDGCCSALVAGGTIHFYRDFDPSTTLLAIEREQLTAWGGVPTMLLLSTMVPEWQTVDLSSLRRVVWGGAAAPRELLETIGERIPHAQLVTSYGSTETTGSVTYTDLDADIDTLATTIGRPDHRYEVRVARPDGTTCNAEEEGELLVRGDFIFQGYLHRPEATAETIDTDGWLHTGDVGILQADGNLRLAGRLKEMYKSGGYNVYPLEIEAVLESHPAVLLAAVVGVPDATWSEVGYAFCIAAPGAAPDPEAIIEFCRERLANYKIPKYVAVRDILPVLPIGKIDKRALAAEARTLVTA